MSKKNTLRLLTGLTFLLASGVLWWNEKQNASFQVTQKTLKFKTLPAAFDGLRLVQLSDLHGNSLEGLVETIQDLKPDLILCTGDIYDGVRYATISDQVLEDLIPIAPVYFVSGNHEYYAGNWNRRKKVLLQKGIHVLDNTCEILEKQGQTLEICGLADPDFHSKWDYARRLQQFEEEMAMLPAKNTFRILLSHRADLFEQSWPVEADLTLSGHLHGGHWRILDRGLIAPNNGDGIVWFPNYTSGLYEKNGHQLFVSRGLGDQMKIPRLFNPPELVCLTLQCASDF